MRTCIVYVIGNYVILLYLIWSYLGSYLNYARMLVVIVHQNARKYFYILKKRFDISSRFRLTCLDSWNVFFTFIMTFLRILITSEHTLFVRKRIFSRWCDKIVSQKKKKTMTEIDSWILNLIKCNAIHKMQFIKYI